MRNEEFSALQFGKLMAAVEGLVSTMQEIQKDLGSQRGINSTLQEKLTSSEKTASEMKTLLTGADGSSGLLVRMTGLEQKLESSTAEIVELKQAFSDTRALVLKIAVAVGVSASAGTAGVSKVLTMFGM